MKSNKNECDCNNNVQSYSDMFHELKNKGEGAFIPFAVAGDPDFDSRRSSRPATSPSWRTSRRCTSSSSSSTSCTAAASTTCASASATRPSTATT